MIGGLGNDIYVVRNASDLAVENVNEGIDTVRAFIGYKLNQNIENLELMGVEALNGTGNDLANKITATARPMC
jgi:hypothetical protein